MQSRRLLATILLAAINTFAQDLCLSESNAVEEDIRLGTTGTTLAITRCDLLEGQFTDDGTDANTYFRYVQGRSAVCYANRCFQDCIIQVENDLAATLDSLAGESQSMCENLDGLFEYNLVPAIG
jgi:hypothetical protein